MSRLAVAALLVGCASVPPPVMVSPEPRPGYYLFVAPYSRASERALDWARGLRRCTLLIVVEDTAPMPGVFGRWAPDPDGSLAQALGVGAFPAFVYLSDSETLRVFGFYRGYTEEKLTEAFPCLRR